MDLIDKIQMDGLLLFAQKMYFCISIKNGMVVSIVIPVFKVSEYIDRCVRSVMEQTYGDIECILVDDASPDDSIARCERLISDYQGPIRFVILHHRQNRGVSAARNTGTAAATGDCVFYLDGDDALVPNSIEWLARPMLNDATDRKSVV